MKSDVPAGGPKVIITGFGSFADIDVNPTQVLIDRLRQDQGKDDIYYEVLPVAVQDVDSFHAAVEGEILVFIHLGVHNAGTCISLERTAYNNMTFRFPDQHGFQPDGVCISCDAMLDQPLHTSLPIGVL